MWLTVTSSFGACPISFTRSDDLFPSLELHFERVICKLRGAKNLTTKVLPSLHSRLSKPFMSFVNHGKLDAKTCWMHIWSSWWSGIRLASLWKPQQERSRNQPGELFSINWVNCSYTSLHFLLETQTPRLLQVGHTNRKTNMSEMS